MTICCILRFQYLKLLEDVATLQDNNAHIKEKLPSGNFSLTLFFIFIQKSEIETNDTEMTRATG